jgi:hypothetical protein
MQRVTEAELQKIFRLYLLGVTTRNREGIEDEIQAKVTLRYSAKLRTKFRLKLSRQRVTEAELRTKFHMKMRCDTAHAWEECRAD